MQWRFYLLSFRWLQHIFYPFGIASILCYMRQAFCMTHLQNTSLIYYFHFSLNAANQKLLCVFGKKKDSSKVCHLQTKGGTKWSAFFSRGIKSRRTKQRLQGSLDFHPIMKDGGQIFNHHILLRLSTNSFDYTLDIFSWFLLKTYLFLGWMYTNVWECGFDALSRLLMVEKTFCKVVLEEREKIKPAWPRLYGPCILYLMGQQEINFKVKNMPALFFSTEGTWPFFFWRINPKDLIIGSVKLDKRKLFQRYNHKIKNM